MHGECARAACAQKSPDQSVFSLQLVGSGAGLLPTCVLRVARVLRALVDRCVCVCKGEREGEKREREREKERKKGRKRKELRVRVRVRVRVWQGGGRGVLLAPCEPRADCRLQRGGRLPADEPLWCVMEAEEGRRRRKGTAGRRKEKNAEGRK